MTMENDQKDWKWFIKNQFEKTFLKHIKTWEQLLVLLSTKIKSKILEISAKEGLKIHFTIKFEIKIKKWTKKGPKLYVFIEN